MTRETPGDGQVNEPIESGRDLRVGVNSVATYILKGAELAHSGFRCFEENRTIAVLRRKLEQLDYFIRRK